MSRGTFQIIRPSSAFWLTAGVAAALALLGFAGAHHMESTGHWVTGMNNRVVWGLPHVFAVFLIVAASGALNVASVASVFKKTLYQPLSRLSGLLAMSLLVGGLSVLVLDLGRPDRLIIAMTYYNFKSIFAWNIFLYTGFLGVVAVYLWMMFEPRMNRFIGSAGKVAFTWRLVLTIGTGSIFGVLVAREAFGSVVLIPMFIAMSLSFGTAVMLLAIILMFRMSNLSVKDEVVTRLRSLLAYFVIAVAFFVAVDHLTRLYVRGLYRSREISAGRGWDLPRTLLGGTVPSGDGDSGDRAADAAPRRETPNGCCILVGVVRCLCAVICADRWWAGIPDGYLPGLYRKQFVFRWCCRWLPPVFA